MATGASSLTIRALILVLIPTFLILFLTVTNGKTMPTAPTDMLMQPPLADTFVASGNDDPNRGQDKRIWVGYGQVNRRQIERSLLKFDLSTIPANSTINVAMLSLYLDVTTQNDVPMTIDVHRLQQDWPETIIWTQHEGLGFDPNLLATTEVTTQFQWYQWDVRALAQDWLNDPNRPASFGVILKGRNETPGQHERAFWSKDCADSDCGTQPGNRPKLEIQFSAPTPIPPPTHIPTPPPTPTPTPGVQSLRLENQPSGELQPGQELTYIIHYQNGPYELSSVSISNTIPTNVKFIEGSIQSSDENLVGTELEDTELGGRILWVSSAPMPANHTGRISYRIERPAGSDDEENFVVVNEGAEMSWQYNGQEGRVYSNHTRNPPLLIYFPFFAAQ